MGYTSLSTILGNGYLPPHRKLRFGGLFFGTKAHFTGPRRGTHGSKCFFSLLQNVIFRCSGADFFPLQRAAIKKIDRPIRMAGRANKRT